MRIGIDLDNTLADYTRPLVRLCAEYGVTPGLGDPKLALRGFLRGEGREPEWTRLQGEIYGRLMAEAQPFAGACDFLKSASAAGISCVVVSHRTRHPIAGQPHDLHEQARNWLRRAGFEGLPVYLEETKLAKVARIESLGVDVFIDDLPELLTDRSFPRGVRRFLFDPLGHHGTTFGLERVASWRDLSALLFP
jgi:hypothetical protein